MKVRNRKDPQIWGALWQVFPSWQLLYKKFFHCPVSDHSYPRCSKGQNQLQHTFSRPCPQWSPLCGKLSSLHSWFCIWLNDFPVGLNDTHFTYSRGLGHKYQIIWIAPKIICIAPKSFTKLKQDGEEEREIKVYAWDTGPFCYSLTVPMETMLHSCNLCLGLWWWLLFTDCFILDILWVLFEVG